MAEPDEQQAALGVLDLPEAPPITRGEALPVHRPKAPAIALLVLGLALTLGPIVGGLFAQVARGTQLLDRFEPHLEADALARYGTDLEILRQGAASVDATYAAQAVPAGRFVGLDRYRQESPAIDARATALLDRIEAAEPDYREVHDIGGFDRVPFLVVGAGIVAIYGACVLLAGRRDRARAAVGLVVLAGAALAAYPFLSDLQDGSSAGERLLPALAPVMQPEEVRALQLDFVVLVQVVGELDTGFRAVPQATPGALDLVEAWPKVSSDLATLIGTLNDNIGNYDALDDLDARTRSLGLSGLAGLPWLLVGVGVASAGLSIAALPRRSKETA